MKLTRISLMAALIAGSVLAFSPALCAQDAKTSNDTNSQKGRPAGGRRAEAMKERMDKLATDLKLTDEQKKKVEAVFKEQGEKMRGLRDLTPEERRTKGKELREEMNKKMKEILTPEQYQKWEKERAQGRPGRGGRRNAPPASGNETK
jgi:protein CpxP